MQRAVVVVLALHALTVVSAAWALPRSELCSARRTALRSGVAAAAGLLVGNPAPRAASAFVAGEDQETSGLVVLRIAEVCSFQEKLLRTIAKCSAPNAKDLVDQFGLPYCGGEAYVVSPGQLLFGTGVMLRNSNLDGNLKLMIQTEVPRAKQNAAKQEAAAIMNTFNEARAPI